MKTKAKPAAQPAWPRVRLRVDFSAGCAVGPGKIALLEEIQRGGSLSLAARELGMSYRRAWLLLDDLNRSFRDAVVTTAVGGRHGGGAQVTAFGRILVREFRRLENATRRLADRRLRAFRATRDARQARAVTRPRQVSGSLRA